MLLGILDFLLLFKEEEARVRKEEADLKLAEQAFDNFYKKMTGKQWKRRKSKKSVYFHVQYLFSRAEQEARITFEKDEHIKTVEAEILQLKADIYNLKVEKRIIIHVCHLGFRMCFANIPCMASSQQLFLLKIGRKNRV